MGFAEFIAAILAAASIPAGLSGLLFWKIKRDIDRREKEKEEKERNTERLMLLIMQNSRATNVLAEATARAVQRIPDAHCNGDMETALSEAKRIQEEEKDFFFDLGIKNMFGNRS